MKEIIGNVVQAQWDGFTGAWGKLMEDMQEIGKMNEQNKKGETVDLVKLNEIIRNLDDMMGQVVKGPGGTLLKMQLGPIRRQMHKWISEIEKKQGEMGNVYKPPVVPPVPTGLPESQPPTPDTPPSPPL